ncbi:bifunctional ADP-dependent NAD(P)H-hydrate dehydratase/NAD(P)H-hydrate epimerase [Butyrivibrio sp. WCD3002]|uniref:bifunctional ADP-dependent NAD(P)H-hydrate dehydratase/NAD(P)H-hydrate epimerase n=1 Tax=Butyrivibrio sp. WCD3002 TaxID=1280676 RepID=UPI0003F6A689|nr:bifunctional ADP-dependent NAD(P)H-hydrate dehydratase/NAD(P)H-hydrate epimerase [Butyrivibrio sp. WCD3002]
MKNTQTIEKKSKYAVNAAEMRRCDETTIEHFGVLQDVLMERAALSLFEAAKEKCPKGGSVVVFAGTGNNGGDGVAAARLLFQAGIDVALLYVGHKKGRKSDALKRQINIAKKYGVPAYYFDKEDNPAWIIKRCDVIIDAMLGTGCSRTLGGEFEKAVMLIDEACAESEKRPYVIAADIPTGINSDNGQICGCCVKADMTVTFGFVKLGQLLFPGNEYVGELRLFEVGITEDGFLADFPAYKYIDRNASVSELIPKRSPSGNKGTFGKVLIVAGSRRVSGACIMAAESALKSGAGMVRIFTEKANLSAVQTLIPEAMSDVYDEDDQDILSKIQEMLSGAIDWADAVVCGPGIGTGEIGKALLRTVLKCPDKKLIFDADAISILANDKEIRDKFKLYHGDKVLTPHLAEFSRLAGESLKKCRENILTLPSALAKDFDASIICKDARSVITDGERKYINISGNDGMATAGSGDVLAGLLGALCCQDYEDIFEASVIGCFLHGRAGDIAAERHGKCAMTARDISEALQDIFADKTEVLK